MPTEEQIASVVSSQWMITDAKCCYVFHDNAWDWNADLWYYHHYHGHYYERSAEWWTQYGLMKRIGNHTIRPLFKLKRGTRPIRIAVMSFSNIIGVGIKIVGIIITIADIILNVILDTGRKIDSMKDTGVDTNMDVVTTEKAVNGA